MSYSFIKKRLDQGRVVILDGGIGAELEKMAPVWIKIYGVENVL